MRPHAGGISSSSSPSIQIEIDRPAMNIDNEVLGLREDVRKLKLMSVEIGESSRANSQLAAGLVRIPSDWHLSCTLSLHISFPAILPTALPPPRSR